MPPMQDEVTGADGSVTQQAQPQMPEPVADLTAVLEAGAEQNLRSDLVTMAYGTKLPLKRSVERDVAGENDGD
jgi:hypothetical protein